LHLAATWSHLQTGDVVFDDLLAVVVSVCCVSGLVVVVVVVVALLLVVGDACSFIGRQKTTA